VSGPQKVFIFLFVVGFIVLLALLAYFAERRDAI
jgi:hypothetical protein